MAYQPSSKGYEMAARKVPATKFKNAITVEAEPEWVIDGREFAQALAAEKVDNAQAEQRKLTKRIAELEALLSEAEKKIAYLRKMAK